MLCFLDVIVFGLDKCRAACTACALVLALVLVASAALPAGAAAASPDRYPAAATRPSARADSSRLARARASGSAVAERSAHVSGKPKKKPKPPAKPALTGNPARALLAFNAMQRTYYILGSGLYEGEPFSYLWPFSQALAATVSMANVPRLGVSLKRELHARLVGLSSYLDTNNSEASDATYTSTLPAFDGTVAPPTGPGGTKYYDDNDWVGIELARLYRLTGDPDALTEASEIMAFEMEGWQTDPTLGCPGGIPFSNAAGNTDRNVVTTAPAAELALQLYRLTHQQQYLQFAEMAYQWVRTCLLQPSGLYLDHVSPSGQVQGALWSYNQGSMIGAGAMLYLATGNSGFLAQARQTAFAAVAYFTPERLARENPFFPSVFFRNLLYLDSITGDGPGGQIAQAYVDYAWAHRRQPGYVFVAGEPRSAQLLVQAAIVQIYALLSSSPTTYF
jgi:hypothetical protein